MDFDVKRQFKVKCHNCHFRTTEDSNESALSAAEIHIRSDWRSHNYEHSVRIAEFTLVTKREEPDYEV